VLLVAPALPVALAARLGRDPAVQRVATPEAAARVLAGLDDPGAPCLVIAPGLLVDQRILSAMLASAPGPLQATFPEAPAAAAARLDARSFDGGVLLLPAARVARTLQGLGDWEMYATLARAAAEAGTPRRNMAALDTYTPALRRQAPLLWAMPRTAKEKAAATDAVVAAAQKGCLDWPARFLHPAIENALVRLLLPTRITPNMVTVATALLGAAATAAFVLGQPFVGLALVLLIGPLDGVDGKLARSRVEFSRWGDLEHVLDKLLEYSWFLALGGWLAQQGHGLAAWLAALGIVAFALAEATQGEFFRRFTGRQLDDWGGFERRFRLVGGRRNTFFWSLLPFAALGLWFEGLLMILAYAAITFAVQQWRFLKRLGEHGRAVSETVRASFAATSYAFLPNGDGGSSGDGQATGRDRPATAVARAAGDGHG
jgi:phosphatidylglycerophosphate synthase